MEKSKKTKGIVAGIVLVLVLMAGIIAFLTVRLGFAFGGEKTFYSGTTVNSVDVSGLTLEDAEQKLSDMAEKYRLSVRFADDSETVAGSEIGLAWDGHAALKKALREQNRLDQSAVSSADLTIQLDHPFTYDASSLSAEVENWRELDAHAGQRAKNAKLVYDPQEGQFTVEPETVGGTVDASQLEGAISTQLNSLSGTLDVVSSGLYGSEIRTADSDEMQQALADANERLKLEITYTYSVPKAGINGTEEISYDLLSQWLYVEEDGITVSVDSDRLQAYVTEMYDTYSVHDNSSSRFVTSNGSFVDVDVPASDETVDTDALFNDIVTCVDDIVGGSRSAPYASTSAGIEGTTDLGGDYVEVDLDDQYLWLYKDKEVIAEGAICSGDVATGCATPAGLYTIKSMETNRWLNGADYHDWVSYWMPFNGGIGLHDATWRSEDEFGGEVYLESGSHGCINMPLPLAEQVFQNVDVGTYVILYGGVASTVDQVQTITGTSRYTKQLGDGPFYLDAKSTGDGALSYTSNNTKVVKVDGDGKVTIVGAGEGTILVTAQATGTYRQATKRVTIVVHGGSSSDKEKEKPNSSPQQQKPDDSSGNQKPDSGDKKPNSGSGGDKKPDEGNSGETSKPDGGDSGETSKPDEGNSGETSKPDEGGSGGESKPDEGGSGESKPDEGGSGGESKPDEGSSGGESKPDEGGSGGESKPDEGNSGETSKPDGGSSSENHKPEGGEPDGPGHASDGSTSNTAPDEDAGQP